MAARSPRRRRHRTRVRVAVVVAAGCLALSACGGGGSGDGVSARKTTRDQRESVRRALAGIPKYPRSRLRQAEVARHASTFVASYAVTGTLPDEILAYYRNVLAKAGFTPASHPTDSGTATRARWERGDETLTVSAARAPTDKPGAASAREPTSQYSLTLEVPDQPGAPSRPVVGGGAQPARAPTTSP